MTAPSLNPRKVPRQARARATRDAILEAATQLLRDEGLEGFNTNAVAVRAGASIGTLYQYYPNKDALMVALILHQKIRMLDDLGRAEETAPQDDLVAGIRILIHAVTKHDREDGRLGSKPYQRLDLLAQWAFNDALRDREA